MADSQTLPVTSEILSGTGLPFRFEVTWESLTFGLKPTSVVRSPRATLELVPRDAKPNAGVPNLGLVLHPVKLTGALPEALPIPEAPLAAPEVEQPRFATLAESVTPRRRTLFLAAGLAVALSVVAYQWTSHNAKSQSASVSGTELGGLGWTEWASEAGGSARGRQLSLYRPSLSKSDYDLEFLGRIERRNLGLVFRAIDSSNYYAARLEAVRPGASALAISRFAVVHGVESPHVQRSLDMTLRPGEMLRIKLEARGPRFTISVQDHVVENWEDGRLKTGGAGFLNERQELGQMGSLQISFPKGGAH